jgi:hypothetical protein
LDYLLGSFAACFLAFSGSAFFFARSSRRFDISVCCSQEYRIVFQPAELLTRS